MLLNRPTKQAILPLIFAALISVSACNEDAEKTQEPQIFAEESPVTSTVPALENAAPVREPGASAEARPKVLADDMWEGRWAGPEGAYLILTRIDATTFALAIASLDGQRNFTAVEDGRGGIAFERDGVTETLIAGNGIDTGMKDLLDKETCLIIKDGEGYCRD